MIEPRNVNFRPEGLRVPLAARADRDKGLTEHGVAKRDLARYYAVIVDSMPEMSAVEAGVIVDVLKDSPMGADNYQYLWAEIADIRWSEERWKVDAVALAEKVKNWSAAEVMAVIDAAERYRIMARAHPKVATGKVLKRAGLVQ